MSSRHLVRRVVLGLVLVAPAAAVADIEELARCQRSIARQGATYAQRVIKATLDCTIATANCQIQCDEGVFGPPCDPTPQPGCCDSSNPASNTPFANCMASAQEVCDGVTLKIAKYEARKQESITNACALVTQDELCGTQIVGLNFDALNAGCLALNPTYTCNLTNLLNCVAGPLEHALADQISALLHPRAGDAIAAQNLHQQFPDIPLTQKVTGQVPEGKVDVWSISGQADDEIVVRVRTRDDTGGGASTLHPILTFLQNNLVTPAVVSDTTVRNVPCNVPNVCGSACPQFKRRLPSAGTFLLAVSAYAADTCAGGRYKLVVTSPNGAVPVLVLDDADAGIIPGGGG